MIHIYMGRVRFKGCPKRWRRLNLFVENSGTVFLPIRHTQKQKLKFKWVIEFPKFLANYLWYEFCNRYVL